MTTTTPAFYRSSMKPSQHDSQPNFSMPNERATPQSLGGEQNTLGACMMGSKSVIAEACEIVTADDFYRELHKKIFAVIVHLFDKGEDVNIFTATEELRRRNQLEEIGNASYLGALIEGCPSDANVAAYAKVVAEKSTLRALLKASENMSALAYRQEVSTEEIIEIAESEVMAVSNRRISERPAPLADTLPGTLARLAERAQNPDSASGVASGFYDLDRMTNGFQLGDFIIFGARPSMGKTSIVSQFAMHAAKQGPVIFFSMEMTRAKIEERLLCCDARVNAYDLRRGRLSPDLWPMVVASGERLLELPLFIVDKKPMTTFEMKIQARRIASQHGTPALIILDHLEEASLAKPVQDKRIRIETVAEDMRNIGHELKCPMMALSQLSRAVENRENKRPVLSDLKETGRLEALGDLVMFLYRDAYYQPKENKPEPKPFGVPLGEEAELIVAKQRDGDTGLINLLFFKEYTRFENKEKEYSCDY